MYYYFHFKTVENYDFSTFNIILMIFFYFLEIFMIYYQIYECGVGRSFVIISSANAGILFPPRNRPI